MNFSYTMNGLYAKVWAKGKNLLWKVSAIKEKLYLCAAFGSRSIRDVVQSG